MLLGANLQPDQDGRRWDAYADAYERVFETLTNAFAARALHELAPLDGRALLDVGAGTGGAALLAAEMGAAVTAIDASAGMVRRIAARALPSGRIVATVQDGMALALRDRSFDAALSNFGVVLFPDPASGMAELYRVLRPGGRVAVVTWTEPHRYELAARLRAATLMVCGELPPGPMPAQLRFVDPDRLRALLADAGFGAIRIARVEGTLRAPSAAALADSLAFAPGMAATLDAMGARRAEVLRAFTRQLEADGQTGPVILGATAHLAVGQRPIQAEGDAG